MAERPTLLSRGSPGAPTAQPYQQGAVQGAFGDGRGLMAAGQGLQQAGAAGTQYAMHAQNVDQQRAKELERNTANDLKTHALTMQKLAVAGVIKQRDERMAAGEADPAPYDNISKSFAEAKQQVWDTLSKDGTLANPAFRKVVSKDELDQHWSGLVDSHESAAASAQYEVKQTARQTELDTLIRASYQGDPTNHTLTYAETLDVATRINESNIKQEAKNKFLNQLGTSMADQISRGIHAGSLPQNEKIINNDLLSTESKKVLEQQIAEQKKKMLPPVDKAPVAKQTIESAIGQARSTKSTAPLDAMATYYSVAALKDHNLNAEAAQAKIDLVRKEVNFANSFTSPFTNDVTYQGVMDFINASTNPAKQQEFRDSISVPGQLNEDYEQTRDNMLATAKKFLAQVDSNQANAIYDSSELGRVSSNRLIEQFKRNAVIPDDAKKYVADATAFQTKLGIPLEKQNVLPSFVSEMVLQHFASNNLDSAGQVMTLVGNTFGPDALVSLHRELANQANFSRLPNGQVQALAGFALVMAMDAAAATGDNARPRTVLDQPRMEILKSISRIGSRPGFNTADEKMVDNAIARSAFNDPVTYRELSHAQQLLPDKSSVQALPQMIAAAQNTYGLQSGDALRAFFRNFIRQRAEQTPSTLTGQDHLNELAGKMVLASSDLVKLVSSAMTVIPSGSFMNERGASTIIPTKMTREDALAVAGSQGPEHAGNVPDYGYQINNTFQNMLVFDPRHNWDRGATKAFDRFFTKVRDFPLFGAMAASGSSNVMPLPDDLKIRAADIESISQALVDKGGEALADYFKKPENRYTYNSVALAQHGQFIYNSKTDSYDLWIDPGPINIQGVPAFSVGSRTQVKYADGKPVSFPKSRVHAFTDAYSEKRFDKSVNTLIRAGAEHARYLDYGL